jgi:hypothetical protein
MGITKGALQDAAILIPLSDMETCGKWLRNSCISAAGLENRHEAKSQKSTAWQRESFKVRKKNESV